MTRAEVEKARRTRGPQARPDREWLREQVQLAALRAASAPEFLHQLAAAGVVVRERRDADGVLSGYAVAREQAAEAPVFFGGGRLAPDLTLPKLQARWQEQADVRPLQVASRAGGPRPTALHRATGVIDHATRQVRQAVANGDPSSLEEAGALAQATAQVLTAAAHAVDGAAGGALKRTARHYDRASREPSQRRMPVTPHSRALTDTANGLLRGGRMTGTAMPVILAQVLLLLDAVRLLREAQGRHAEARAAQQATLHLRTAVRQQQREFASRAAVAPTPARSSQGRTALPRRGPSKRP